MSETQPASQHQKYLPDGYRKRDVFVSRVAAPYTARVASYWDGGSRSYWVVYKKGSSSATPVGGEIWGKSEAPTVTLEAGDILVQSSIFCGKTATAAITYVEAAV